MKIVVAPDSFKGCLSSRQVSLAVEQGLRMLWPDREVVSLSIADGGEGLVDALAHTIKGELCRVVVSDPLGRPVLATYAREGNRAYIEMAAASGLPLLQPGEYNPALASTYGTGELILHALQHGCRQMVIGLGGSATNDAGMGMLQALGYRFYDDSEQLITRACGAALAEVARIDDSMVPMALQQAEFVVASDVDIPLVGPRGATQMFARQKGADDVMLRELESGMENFAQVLEQTTGVQVREIAGAGAAGGTGAALCAFMGAEIRSGIDVVLDAIALDEMMANADLVITGEGKLDYQTAAGKAACGVLKRAKKFNLPIIAIAGQVEMCEELERLGFDGIYAVTPAKQNIEIAMQPDVAAENIKHTIARVLESYPLLPSR